MEAIRINQKLESETLHLPQLREFLGQQVEIIILAQPPADQAPPADGFPLRGSVLRDDSPWGPVISAEEWEANG